jgi:flagellar biosynthesis protein FlhF
VKLYTFTGSTPTIALSKAQSACGEDALVVNTKMIRKKTLSKDGLYEVVVALEDSRAKESQTASFDSDNLDLVEDSIEQSDIIDRLAIDENITHNSKEIQELKESIVLVNERMLKLQEIMLDQDSRGDFFVPPEFMSIYSKLKKSGMKYSHLKSIIGESIKYMPPYMKDSDQTIQRYFRVLLKKMLPIRKEMKLSSQKIMIFVGPTGVGKTTTLAKLAARYSFLQGNYKVGIITLDTYRIGALEQLYQYSKMMKLPIEDLVDPVDFDKALNRFINMDIILIDSAGSSQYDRDKLEKIKDFLDSTELKVEVNLVLSANSKLEDLEDTLESFKFLNIDTLMVTKFDETKNFGNIFSLIKDSKLPLSYFLNGQEVPDDLKEADGNYLVECLLEGYRGE